MHGSLDRSCTTATAVNAEAGPEPLFPRFLGGGGDHQVSPSCPDQSLDQAWTSSVANDGGDVTDLFRRFADDALLAVRWV